MERHSEHATFTVAPKLAYGAAGNASLNVPANAELRAAIELVDFVGEPKSYGE